MKLFAQKEAEAFIATGQPEFVYSEDVRLTPMAKDLLLEAGIKVRFQPGSSLTQAGSAGCGGGSQAGAGQPVREPVSRNPDPVTPEMQALFHCPKAEALKQQICDIGRRLWQREYVDGNGGNISCRLADGVFLCTPTGVSKGFLTPDMLCAVDLDGKQLAGTWRRTSEITTHLAIYRTTPQAFAVVHAHPVHATAFAMAGVEPPQCLIPEIEVFVGRVPVAPYRTPGSPEMAEVIGPMAPQHQSILMGNHGVICWGTSVEDAYFKMEITDAYCRTLVIASHIPTSGSTIPGEGMKELLEMKKNMGLPDPRVDLQPVQLCEVDPWKFINSGCCSSAASSGPDLSYMTNAEIESLVQQVTDQIMASLVKG